MFELGKLTDSFVLTQYRNCSSKNYEFKIGQNISKDTERDHFPTLRIDLLVEIYNITPNSVGFDIKGNERQTKW